MSSLTSTANLEELNNAQQEFQVSSEERLQGGQMCAPTAYVGEAFSGIASMETSQKYAHAICCQKTQIHTNTGTAKGPLHI